MTGTLNNALNALLKLIFTLLKINVTNAHLIVHHVRHFNNSNQIFLIISEYVQYVTLGLKLLAPLTNVDQPAIKHHISIGLILLANNALSEHIWIQILQVASHALQIAVHVHWTQSWEPLSAINVRQDMCMRRARISVELIVHQINTLTGTL